ncbi:MAG: GNAT family N-acetyltransferase [Noviherbaspirillum sp.]
MSAIVRQAGLTDLDAIAPLFDAYRQFYGQASNPALARAFIAERLGVLESVILVAENGDSAVVGFTQLYPSFSSVSARRIWILNDLFVTPAARGQSVAHALLAAARAHAIATGAKRLVLSTARDNPAQALYESLGYERDAAYYHYSLEL